MSDEQPERKTAAEIARDLCKRYGLQLGPISRPPPLPPRPLVARFDISSGAFDPVANARAAIRMMRRDIRQEWWGRGWSRAVAATTGTPAFESFLDTRGALQPPRRGKLGEPEYVTVGIDVGRGDAAITFHHHSPP